MNKYTDKEYDEKKEKAIKMIQEGIEVSEIAKETGIRKSHVARWKSGNGIHSAGEKKLGKSIANSSNTEEASKALGISKSTIKKWVGKQSVLEPKLYRGTSVPVNKKNREELQKLAAECKRRSGVTAMEWFHASKPNSSDVRRRIIEKMLIRGIEEEEIKVILNMFKTLPKFFTDTPDNFASLLQEPIEYPSKRNDHLPTESVSQKNIIKDISVAPNEATKNDKNQK